MNRRVKISAWSVLRPGEQPDIAFVPPLVRRRLSPLQKIYFALARTVDAPGAAFVFASRDGEITLTQRIVADFKADGSVSPHRFSASVYNAAPGLWSVFTKNTAAYTAIAAGDETVECGLLETLNACRAGQDAVLVSAEETGGGYGLAMRLTEEEDGTLDSLSVVGCSVSSGKPRHALSLDDLVGFVSIRQKRTLAGKWISLSRSSVG